jgi:hypothetical protein
MPCLPSQEKLPLKNLQAREEPLERNAEGALLITQTKSNLKRDVDLRRASAVLDFGQPLSAGS